jgi:hypothetical protein
MKQRRVLNGVERRIIRGTITKSSNKCAITLRSFDEPNSRVTPSPASAEREKAAPARTPHAGAAASSGARG